MTTASQTSYVLKCGKCGWQRKYPFRPAWNNWDVCPECKQRGVKRTDETNKERPYVFNGEG